MLQIKTIYYRIASEFDEEVNAALAEGWTLTRRAFAADGFLAELTREVITEAERCCDNCAHSDKDPNREPCRGCEDGEIAPTNWEPAKKENWDKCE